MKDPDISVLRSASNYPVVQVSNRRYPGVVVQGDTLFSFAELARKTRESLAEGRTDEAGDLAAQLEDGLGEYLAFYESVLGAEGIKLPYFRTTESSSSSS